MFSVRESLYKKPLWEAYLPTDLSIRSSIFERDEYSDKGVEGED